MDSTEVHDMFRSSLALLPLISALGAAVLTSAALAQQDPMAPKRAINLARGAAAAANGGLRSYHPANCMFADPTGNPCLTKRDDSGFQFEFQGGPPGWEVLGLPATLDSTVLIAPDGRSVVDESHQEIGDASYEDHPI